MRLPYQTDSGCGTRACLGLIVLHIDETIESEFRRLTDIGDVAVYTTRVPSGEQLYEETIRAMAADIPVAARLFPAAADLDVIGYACTSGATIIGPENITEAIRQARRTDGPGSFAHTKITDPLTAVKAATRALEVKRLGFLTPYIASVSGAMRAALEAEGLTIGGFGSFETSEEAVVARISPDSILQAILRVGRSAACDAVFVSCTHLRTLDVLTRAEEMLGLPVISSTQALAWHMLRQAGITHRPEGMGRLMTL